MPNIPDPPSYTYDVVDDDAEVPDQCAQPNTRDVRAAIVLALRRAWNHTAVQLNGYEDHLHDEEKAATARFGKKHDAPCANNLYSNSKVNDFGDYKDVRTDERAAAITKIRDERRNVASKKRATRAAIDLVQMGPWAERLFIGPHLIDVDLRNQIERMILSGEDGNLGVDLEDETTEGNSLALRASVMGVHEALSSKATLMGNPPIDEETLDEDEHNDNEMYDEMMDERSVSCSVCDEDQDVTSKKKKVTWADNKGGDLVMITKECMIEEHDMAMASNIVSAKEEEEDEYDGDGDDPPLWMVRRGGRERERYAATCAARLDGDKNSVTMNSNTVERKAKNRAHKKKNKPQKRERQGMSDETQRATEPTGS